MCVGVSFCRSYAICAPSGFVIGWRMTLTFLRISRYDGSVTNHIFRLGELLGTEPSYREFLKKVNVILHPMTNPDGAQMAYDLQKLTPTHMLHAGRYSALGQDVESNGTLLPESQVRGKVWREWLPDIYLNPHGYPSHEWVQQFAGYVPPGFRSYWSTRGWYTNLSGVRDPRQPDLIEATEALRE